MPGEVQMYSFFIFLDYHRVGLKPVKCLSVVVQGYSFLCFLNISLDHHELFRDEPIVNICENEIVHAVFIRFNT